MLNKITLVQALISLSFLFSCTKNTEQTGAMKFVLEYYHADWCEPCRMFEKEVLTEKDFKKFMEQRKIVLKKYNCTEKNQAENCPLDKNKISYVPIFKIINVANNSNATFTGYRSNKSFMIWLDQTTF